MIFLNRWLPGSQALERRKIEMKKWRSYFSDTLFMILMISVIFQPSFSQAAPNLINYQGSLTDSGGTPVTDLAVSMTFRIYDAATGGTPLWEETQTVAVTNGIYNVLLGSSTANPAYGTFDPSLFSGDSRWLEIVVNGETLTPRQRIASVAYSLRTAEAGNADTVDGKHATDLLDKATYDANVNGKVDQAESSDTAATAATASNVTGVVAVANGGTGATSAPAARSNLGAAASGANSDITSLSGLTTPLSAGQGGTGTDTAAAAGGSLLTATGIGGWNLLAPGAEGEVLKIAGGLPAWGTGGGTIYSAGTGLNLSGTTFNVNVPLTLTNGFSTGLLGGTVNAIEGVNASGNGLWGYTSDLGHAGVRGENSPGSSVGELGSGKHGVYGSTNTNMGYGVYGRATDPGAYGVFGENVPSGNSGYVGGDSFGVKGYSVSGSAVEGSSTSGKAVYGYSAGSGTGGYFSSSNGYGLIVQSGNAGIGTTAPAVKLQVDGGTDASLANGTGYMVLGSESGTNLVLDDNEIMARNNGAGSTLYLNTESPTAKVVVRILEIIGGADLAEPFPVKEEKSLRPGMAVSIDPDHPGELKIAELAYDPKVAGIVSGAGGIRPGVTMKQAGTAAGGNLPVALSGRVYAWADASFGAIRPGDLLTTSDNPGHLMKAADRTRAPGAILGKAMTSLKEGEGLVLVLVSLQ